MSIKGLSLHFYKEGMDYPEYVFGLVLLLGGGGGRNQQYTEECMGLKDIVKPIEMDEISHVL